MLGRVTLRVLPPRTFITRTRSSSKAFGNMSVGADSEQPPAKMARVEDFLRVKKISENAVLPVRGSQGAAGYDLASAYECVIPARGKGLVKTDLSIAIPKGTYARVAPRSGLAWKHFIDVGAGVVDYDYRGNVGVILFNHGDADFEVRGFPGTPDCLPIHRPTQD